MVPTVEWEGQPITSDKIAYYMAKDQRYTFSPDQLTENLDGVLSIGELTVDELNDIASYPPILLFEDYLKLMYMSIDEILNEYPAIEAFIDEPTDEDIWYYPTRQYLPGYPSLVPIMKRWEQYYTLNELSQSLLDLLYEDDYGFAETNEVNELEPIIIAFDDYLYDEAILISLAERYGFSINPGSPIQETLFFQLENHILNNYLPKKNDIY